MKKIAMSLATIAAVMMLAVSATGAWLTDPEAVNSNTFSGGSINLLLDDQDGPFTNKFTAQNMAPGTRYTAGVTTLKNIGTLDGKLSLKINNPRSDENGLIEPETGDVVGQEIDHSGYNANTGDGELWDQTTLKICVESGAGSHATNGICDWDDTIIYSNDGTPGNDYSAYYGVPLSSDIAGDNNVVIAPNQTKRLVVEVYFVNDESDWWWGGMAGVTNNMAMTDTMSFDMEFALNQIH